MTLGADLVVTAGALAGGFVSGLAGFGTGLVSLGIWLYVIPPTTAAALVAACSVLGQAQTLPTVWHAIPWRRTTPMLAAGLVGVPVGTALLALIDPALFRLCIGLLLIGFSAFMLLAQARVRIAWGGAPADTLVGLAGGVLGGLAGLSGPLPVIWATLRGWPKDERRAVFQMFNLVVLGAVLLWQLANGLVAARFPVLLALAFPGTLLGNWLGIRAYRRLSDRDFRTVVLGLLALSGSILVWSSR